MTSRGIRGEREGLGSDRPTASPFVASRVADRDREPATRARPILFSAAMVRALLAGTKTQTRRIVKPQPNDGLGRLVPLVDAEWAWDDGDLSGLWTCPYGVPGDLLIVRENHALVPATAYRMSEGVQQTVNPSDPYEAAIYAAGWERSIPKWRPSIHMHRWASRLTLEITDVRVQRLQKISEADALAEGTQEPTLVPTIGACWSERDAYAKLWEHINGAGSWVANPWVWALSFKVHRQNVDDLLRERGAA